MAWAVELLGRPASVREARGFIADVLAGDGGGAVGERAGDQRRRPCPRADLPDGAHGCALGTDRSGRPGTSSSGAARCNAGRSRRTRLLVVDKLATDWGTEQRATHKVVWFEIAR